MDEKHVSEQKLRSAAKSIEWMEISKPSVAARTEGVQQQSPEIGQKGLPADGEALAAWCREHQT